jgi:phospholipid/cholesterol/gamma-HCH transport system substrate-binding protein
LINKAALVGGHAVLTVGVANMVGPVYRNAQAELRPNTALQDMYLDIVNRGTPNAGIAGPNDVIPLSQTQSPTNLADVLNTFQPDVRTQLYNILDQLGNGLQGRGQDLNRAFARLAPFLNIAGNVSKQLAVRASMTRQLVHNAAVLSGVLAARSTQLRTLITSGTDTLDALSTEGGVPLREAIADFPATLRGAHDILTALSGLEPNLDSALGSLGPVADRLPSGLADLRSLADRLAPAASRLQTPVVKLVPLADQLRPFSSALAGSLRQLSPQVSDVDKLTRDAASCMTQIAEFFNWDASVGKFSDSQGVIARGNVNFGFYSLPTGPAPANYTFGSQCSGARPLANAPTPKYDGPPSAP